MKCTLEYRIERIFLVDTLCIFRDLRKGTRILHFWFKLKETKFSNQSWIGGADRAVPIIIGMGEHKFPKSVNLVALIICLLIYHLSFKPISMFAFDAFISDEHRRRVAGGSEKAGTVPA